MFIFVFVVQTEKLSHADLDQRALDALKEFPAEGALAVLKQFLESNLVNYSVADPEPPKVKGFKE